MTVFLSVLPWLAVGLVVLEFSLTDDLPSPRVRRVFVGVGLGLVALTAVVLAFDREAEVLGYLLCATGPLAFLLLHHLLRTAFRGWKGEEPVLATVGSRGGGRFFYEKGVHRRVTALDYLYSFLVGVAMLLASMAALAVIME